MSHRNLYRVMAGIVAGGIGLIAYGTIDAASGNENLPPGCGVNYEACPRYVTSCAWVQVDRRWQWHCSS